MKNTIISVIVSFALVVGLTGCGATGAAANNGSTEGAAASTEEKVSKFTYEGKSDSGWTFTGFTTVDDSELNEEGLYEFDFAKVAWSDPVYIAEAEGFFKKYGLKANIGGFMNNINDPVTAVASGQLNFACNHATAIAQSVAAGYEIVGIAAGWATTEERPMITYLTKEDRDDINTLQDLEGKTIAIPAETEGPWLATLDALGLEGKVNTTIVSIEKQEEALLTNRVDVIYSINPYTEQRLKDGGVKVIGTLVDAIGEDKGWPQQYTNRKFAKEHPDIVKSYVAAIADACDFGREHPEEAGIDVARALGVDESQGEIYNPAFPEHALIDDKSAQYWIDEEEKFGLLSSSITVEDYSTNEYNPYYKEK